MTLLKKTASFVLAAAMLAGCGSAASTASTAASTTSAAAASSGSGNILTIATTNQLSTLNPLQMNWNFVDMYATSLEFLPLAVLDDNYEFTPMLVESITTDDNLTFHVKVADNAAWSDGEPVTSDDIIWTILKMTSPAVANTHFDFSMIKGLESGLSEEGADSVEGLVKVDDKDLDIVLNRPMALSTFLNNLATWILILPKHALEDIPDDQLVGNAWFNAPTVVSGPYMATEEDLAHYVTYKANENYFLGAPKIETVNLQVYDGSSVLAALQTGDVQFVHPAICDIPYQDRDAVENLDGFTVTYAKPITNEMTFFNCHNLPDVNLRKAIVEAIDRDTIVSSLLPNNGQRGDGWIPQADTTFYDASAMETIPYDPEDAKALLAQSDYNGETLEWYVNSGDSVLVNAATIAQQNLLAVGINVEIQTVDFDTLTGQIAGSDKYDMFSVQYTITPIDYYADVNSLANAVYGPQEDTDEPERSWTGDFYSDEFNDILQATQTADSDQLKQLYIQMQNFTVENVPMFSLYFLGSAGVVSDRLSNATPSFFGAFNNIQDWELN
ncbi:ABC transporter substrate-binding protein [Galactobacillus timonensis]|uniref:ABC transporter substrate-binding protein n=1 Tax=Galactobacillus timonensis TaxID=2041840 RepID=UPI002409A0CD|nr:ABC transporter substrate-binding protein [Galactobacillus timonensis]MDD6369135.1 ABC transporter substrate-binding protein [Galactobacillus timonensis]